MAKNKKEEGHPRRSTGNVVEPGDGYLANGKPNLSPSAGYDRAEPIQYSDESDTQFELRHNQWMSAFATAKAIEGSSDFSFQREMMEKRHEAEEAQMDAQEEQAKEANK